MRAFSRRRPASGKSARAAARRTGSRAGSNSGTPICTRTSPSSSTRGTMTPATVPTRSPAFREAAVEHEAGETACAVAAILDLAAVGVEDPIVEIGVGRARRLDHQHLVAADAETPVGERRTCAASRANRLARGIDHDEVVAEALHLGEPKTHATRFGCRCEHSRAKCTDPSPPSSRRLAHALRRLH